MVATTLVASSHKSAFYSLLYFTRSERIIVLIYAFRPSMYPWKLADGETVAILNDVLCKKVLTLHYFGIPKWSQCELVIKRVSPGRA